MTKLNETLLVLGVVTMVGILTGIGNLIFQNGLLIK